MHLTRIVPKRNHSHLNKQIKRKGRTIIKRGYPVSLKDLASRLKAVQAIGKITKTMKVVASSKMQQSQDAADQSTAFFQSLRKVFEPMEKKNERSC